MILDAFLLAIVIAFVMLLLFAVKVLVAIIALIFLIKLTQEILHL
jgi:hypothetical protein